MELSPHTIQLKEECRQLQTKHDKHDMKVSYNMQIMQINTQCDIIQCPGHDIVSTG